MCFTRALKCVLVLLMWKKDAVLHFGSQRAVAEALRVTEQAISAWPEIIPEGKAYKLQVLTKGKLKVDESLYQKIA